MNSKPTIKLKSCLTVFSLSYILCMSCTINSEAKANDPIAEQLSAGSSQTNIAALPTALPPTGKKKIKIALLLDTSGSMDGLINQAKSQLWKLVNEHSNAKCENEKPELEIALYEYGNDNLPSSEGYIRQVSQFSNDLDLISEKLFALSTNGGNEFCGYVIGSSLKQLDWAGDDHDLRIIFIAGNEPFTQGGISYVTSCNTAKQKDVIVNTIYCGQFDEGLRTGWKNGAVLTGGEYMSIEQDRQTVYIESPYDAEIAQLNDKINDTYISYGVTGYTKKMNQAAQDKNAAVYGSANTTNRIVSKTSSFYSNKTWDIVDASKEKDFDVSKIKEAELPAELKGKTKEEKEKFIATKTAEREAIKTKIIQLNKSRTEYILEKEKEKQTEKTSSLDGAMLKAIKDQATKKKFVFES
jgi:hypothetical protein